MMVRTRTALRASLPRSHDPLSSFSSPARTPDHLPDKAGPREHSTRAQPAHRSRDRKRAENPDQNAGEDAAPDPDPERDTHRGSGSGVGTTHLLLLLLGERHVQPRRDGEARTLALCPPLRPRQSI
ncbi:hypothetical protein FKP32DRAFT_1759058 [Trametes sanguinea]|nr:hypothetical protein FKP32DRAFT_1759058 [Trametes sanguinea]